MSGNSSPILEGEGTMAPVAERTDWTPDLRGCFRLNGQVYWIAGWHTTSPTGRRLLRLKIGRDPSRDREPVTQS